MTILTRAALVPRLVLLCVALALGQVPLTARAQDPIVPHGARFWVGAAVLTGTAFALDRPLHAYAVAHQTRSLNHLADDVDPLGRAQYEESGRPWVAGLAYGAASLVAAQRVYRQAHWASDVARLASVRSALRPRVQAAPLSDPHGRTRELEAAFRVMWRAWCGR